MPVVPLLQAALNGARTKAEHPAIPSTPAELAADAHASVAAGAAIVHVHGAVGSVIGWAARGLLGEYRSSGASAVWVRIYG